MTTRKRTLKHHQVVRLTEWMQTNRARAMRETLHTEDVASLASTELGFEIAEATVKKIAKALSIKLAGMRDGKARKSKVRVVAQELVQLLERLDEPIADELLRVAENR